MSGDAELQKAGRADEGPPALLDEQVRRFVRASKAASTLRGYGDFCRWCDERGLCPLPAAAEDDRRLHRCASRG